MVTSRTPLTGLALLVLLACPVGVGASDVVTVNAGTVVRKLSGNPIGINFNYLRDDNHNRPEGTPTIQSVMKKMKIQWVRYPGGEKSDWTFFAKAPWEKADTQVLAHYQKFTKDILDFDEYIAYVREIGARPLVVVPYESQERSGVAKEVFLEHAVEWVRYANVKKGYGVTYWEIGNENWHNKTGTAKEIGEVAKEFAAAMKAVDPTIQVGCSVNSRDWAKTILELAGAELGFLSRSTYVGWKQGFDLYREAEEIVLDGQATEIVRTIADSPHRDHIKLIVTEFNAVDFNKEWPWRGDLGHAIVAFDLAGQLLCNDGVMCAMQWGTRWMDDAKPEEMWYALGERNEILPPGRSLAIWGAFLKTEMVQTSGPKRSRTFASFDPKTGALSVFIINKDAANRTVDVVVKDTGQLESADVYYFAGTGDADTSPTWSKAGTQAVSSNTIKGVELPGTSITVLDMRGSKP